MPYPQLPAAVAALFGLIVGSFLNVVIHRLPLMLEREWRRQCEEMLATGKLPTDDGPPFNLMTPRSACPACKAPIKPWHNVPVVSYLLLRGRCAACGSRIALRYPLVEALSGAVAVIAALRFGITLEGVGVAALCWCLIAIACIDLDRQIIPDIIALPLLWLGVALATLGDYRGGFAVLADLQSSVIGAMAGYLVLWVVYQAFHLLTGREGMGYGDFKLLAALGAWLGWQMLPLIILLSAMVGALVGIGLVVLRGRDRGQPLPFGPFLAAAGFVALFWGRALITAYRGLSGL